MRNVKILSATVAIGLLFAAASPALAVDNDGDGWDTPADCNDFDTQTHPGAFEVVGDGVDQNCDAQEACYVDSDDDGARTTVSALSSDTDCNDVFEGRAADPLDCDDSDPNVSPLGTEVCDGGDVDEDCDGSADDLDPEGAAGAATWYPDADGDGYGGGGGGGGGGGAILACDAPTGTVAEATDCDDTDASISPGDPEICDAANEDEDCDGLADDADTGATGRTDRYTDGDSDGFGDIAAPGVPACDAIPGSVSNATDCDDSDPAISPAAAEVCNTETKDDDCDGTTDCDDEDCSAAPTCSGTVEVFDHLECFKIKTTEKLKAYLDVDPGTNPPFELAAGCTIGKATKYCVPVMKTVAVVDAKSTLTPDPNYEGQELTDDRICYKVKCPDTAVTTITLTLRDRFGNRQFSKFKSSEICTPAEQVP